MSTLGGNVKKWLRRNKKKISSRSVVIALGVFEDTLLYIQLINSGNMVVWASLKDKAACNPTNLLNCQD